MNNLGYCYELGGGVDQDMTKAFELYEQSALLGHSTAMYNLGNCYKCARGVLKDLEKAKEWYTKAVGKGYVNAQTVLDELNAA
jgi:TPR repeat protein